MARRNSFLHAGVWPVLGILALFLSAKVPTAAAQNRNDFTEAIPQLAPSTNVVIVKLSSPPVASAPESTPQAGEQLSCTGAAARDYGRQLDGQQADFINYLRSAAPAAQVLRQFKVVFNGLAVALNGTDKSVVLAGPHVAGLSFSRRFAPTMNVSHGVIGTQALWAALGGPSKAGLGIKAGIIDSGIDQTHPFLTDPSLPVADGFPQCDIPANCQFTSKKVIVARAYPQDGTTSAKGAQEHGTHVSGTVAGLSGTAAPFATAPLSGGLRRPILATTTCSRAIPPVLRSKTLSPRSATRFVTA